MAYELMDPYCAHDGALSTIPKNNTSEESSPVTLISTSPYSELSLPVLAAHCQAEIDNYRRGEPYTERYGLELLHRALR